MIMKRLLILIVTLCSIHTFAQQSYTVNGQEISLYTAVEGKLSLLWNTVDGEYQYFLQKDNEVIPLKNTKTGNKYAGEYKVTLERYTLLDATKVKYTKPSLSKLIDEYNQLNDPNYVANDNSLQLKTRLGGFLGATNYVYFVNPDNTFLTQLGAEFEIMDPVVLKRHSMVLQLRQLFGNSDFDFNSTQLSLNYRFKAILIDELGIYVNTKIAGYYYVSQDITLIENNGEPNNISESSGEFIAPFAFGIGADIPVGNGFITFQYQDIFTINQDDNGEFSIDFALGYKFNL